MPDRREQAHEFCRRIRPRLVGSLTLLCGDPAVAEELAQEVLARVWVHWSRVRDLGEPAASAWTYRVAVNLANSWWRRRAAERRALARIGVVEPVADTAAAESVELRVAVAALPRRQRTALILRYYVDLPVAHVADLMGCAEGTVKALTSQAIGALRRIVTSTEATDGR